MNKIFYLLAMITLFFCTSIQGDDIATEVVPALYFKIPFGSTADNSFTPRMGFQVTKVEYDRSRGMELFSSSDPSLFDISFKRGSLNQVSFNGVDIIKTKIVHNVDGTSSTIMESETFQVVAAVLVGGLLIYAIADSDEVRVCGGINCPDKPVDP